MAKKNGLLDGYTPKGNEVYMEVKPNFHLEESCLAKFGIKPVGGKYDLQPRDILEVPTGLIQQIRGSIPEDLNARFIACKKCLDYIRRT